MGLQLYFREKEESLVLSFEDFRDEIMKDLIEICGPEFTIAERNVVKNNGVMLCGVSITAPDEVVSPAIYLESLYDEYENGKMNIQEVENEILRIYVSEKDCRNADMGYISDFDRVKDKLIFRLINADLNEELLKSTPHRRFLDLAVIYTIYIEDFLSSPGTITVKQDLMEEWGVDESTLYEYALVNSPRIKQPVMQEISDIIRDMMGNEDIDEDLADTGLIKMYVLTNSDKFYGDTPILYPGFLKNLRETTGSDFFLLPSSVHEFIVIPDTGNIDPKELKELVMSVNRSSVTEEEFLSDNVYVYRNEEISICA